MALGKKKVLKKEEWEATTQSIEDLKKSLEEVNAKIVELVKQLKEVDKRVKHNSDAHQAELRRAEDRWRRRQLKKGAW